MDTFSFSSAFAGLLQNYREDSLANQPKKTVSQIVRVVQLHLIKYTFSTSCAGKYFANSEKSFAGFHVVSLAALDL